MLVSRHAVAALQGRPALPPFGRAIRRGGAECVPPPRGADVAKDEASTADVGILPIKGARRCPGGACVADPSSSLGGRCASAPLSSRRIQSDEEMLATCLETCPESVDLCNETWGPTAPTTVGPTTTTGPTATADLQSILDSLEDISDGLECFNELLSGAMSDFDATVDAVVEEQEEQFQGCLARCPAGSFRLCHCSYPLAESADIYACAPDTVVEACQDGVVSECLLDSETRTTIEKFYCPAYLCAATEGGNPEVCCESYRSRCDYCAKEGALEELYLCWFWEEGGGLLETCEGAELEKKTLHYGPECAGVLGGGTATAATPAATAGATAAAAEETLTVATDGATAEPTENPDVSPTVATESTGESPPSSAGVAGMAGMAGIGAGAAMGWLVFSGLFNQW
ncbi:hypothetical protein ACHAXT_013334 [Thalassiosira profunda]